MAGKVSSDPNVFILPDLGEGLEEAELIAWKVSEGDTVLATTRIVPVWTAGIAVVQLPRLSAGVHELTVRYDGSTAVAASEDTITMRVVSVGRH